MNIKSIGLIIFIISGSFTSVWADEVFTCRQNIADPSHPFYWENIKTHVPDSLGPGDTKPVYENFNRLYLERLSNNSDNLTDAQNKFISIFKQLQNDILNGKKTANISINTGDDGFELNSGAKLVSDNVPCKDIDLPYFRDIAYMTIAYKKIHFDSWETLMGAASRRIQHLGQQYEDWFNNGLPMWPQETYFNGLLLDESDAVEAKKWQLVVVRPSVGLGINTNNSLNKNKPEATLGIEPVGFVKYIKNDYSGYWGLSMLLTVGDDVGIGYGLLARYNKYTFGLTRRGEDIANGITDDNVYFYVGYDLYDLFHDKKNKFQGYKKKVRENLDRYK